MPHYVYGGQRTVFGSWFSPCTMWVLNMELGCQRWQQAPLCPEPSHQSHTLSFDRWPLRTDSQVSKSPSIIPRMLLAQRDLELSLSPKCITTALPSLKIDRTLRLKSLSLCVLSPSIDFRQHSASLAWLEGHCWDFSAWGCSSRVPTLL